MAGRYGTASAGGRTIADPCDLPLCSSNGDGAAWWLANKEWRGFLLGLVEVAESKVPITKWPTTLQTGLLAARAAADTFADDANYPWVLFGGQIAQWAAAQQTMRDFSGQLADFLETQGVRVGGPPAQAPPAPSALASLQTLVKVAAVGVAGWLALSFYRSSRK